MTRHLTATALLAGCFAAAACASAPDARAAQGWSPSPRLTTAVPVADIGIRPQAAIAADGTGAVAWAPRSRRLVVTPLTRSGRFGATRTLVRGFVGSAAAAAAGGGAFVVAWTDGHGVRIAIRTAAGRRIAARRVVAARTVLGRLELAADPRGGWVLAYSLFPSGDPAAPTFGVGALSLNADGSPRGVPQDLGPGALAPRALAVDDRGRAVLAIERPAGAFDARQPLLVAQRVHAGRFSPPQLAAIGVDEAQIAAGPSGRTAIAASRIASCGDGGFCTGDPAIVPLSANGTPGAMLGPRLAQPRRAFAPSAQFVGGGRAVLVFGLKEGSRPRRFEAPLRALTVAPDGALGPLQTLTAGDARGATTAALSGGRVLALWTGRRGLGAALAGPDGRFRRVRAPSVPPPGACCASSSLRSAGRYVLHAWSHERRIRMSWRRF